MTVIVLGGFFSGHPFVIGLGPLILVLLIARGLLGGSRHRDHGRPRDHGRHR